MRYGAWGQVTKDRYPELSLSFNSHPCAVALDACPAWVQLELNHGDADGASSCQPSACVACYLREDLHALQLAQLRNGDRPVSHLGLEFVQSIHDLLSAFYTGAPSLFLCLQIGQ